MRINSVEIEDTFAEALKMCGARLIITAVNEKWATEAARRATRMLSGGTCLCFNLPSSGVATGRRGGRCASAPCG
jgi:formylmethanofuran:tetrahydromethanopterin formyltransferase